MQILAINDFHGNIEPPKRTIAGADTNGAEVKVPVGGVAYMAGALEALRQGQPNSITVSAGDLIGASPLTSALFLDEPTITPLNLVGLELAAVGNHEFDKGSAELLRMQRGGCEKYTGRQPCAARAVRRRALPDISPPTCSAERRHDPVPGHALKQFGADQDRLHRHDAEGNRRCSSRRPGSPA